jgi:MFS family permease
MFTHAYGTMLVPLYLLMRADLRLGGVKAAALIVTVYGVTYSILSYKTGVLADRHDRRTLLGIGLLGNALAITLMGFTHQYALLLGLAVIGGMFGALFHPTANALIPAHYPKSPGMAIGLLGIGSGLGFYVGPKFSGWRAESAHWQLWHVAAWQKPLIEMGLAGIICAVLFLLFASEAEHRTEKHPPLGRTLRRRVLLIGATLGCRDFAGVSSVSLIGIYLQKAHGLSAQKTGAILGSMMLISIVVNPLAVWVSPRGKRLPVMVCLLAVGGVGLAVVPRVPLAYLMLVLAFFQTCHLGSYAVSDAAMLERVPGNLRGRVVGVFLTLAGTAAACGPWVMGFWTDLLGPRASQPAAYGPVFAVTGAIMCIAMISAPIIAQLGAVQGTPIEPFSETMPGTVEVVG